MGVKFSIPIPEKISSNKIYSGVHWAQRKAWADDMHQMVMLEGLDAYSGPFPANFSYHFKLHGKLLDSSNVSFLQKLVEDGLVQSGFIPDDSPDFVSWVAMKSDRAKKGEKMVVEVEVVPVSGTIEKDS